MKKVLFWMLFLLVLGTVNVKAQVRIGGNTAPDAAAVLDLNVDGSTTGTKGLALPRVNLTSNTMQLVSGVTNLTGMLVYNTTATLGVGIYFWDGGKWQPLMAGSLVEKDSVIGNEVIGATPGRGLVAAGSGTAASPYTLGIAPQGVDSTMMKSIPGTPGILASVSGTWRPMWYGQIYDAWQSFAAGAIRYDTLDVSHCRVAPQIAVVAYNPGYPLVWWRVQTLLANRIVVASQITGQTMPSEVQAMCWMSF